MAPYRTYAMAFSIAARHAAGCALLGHGRSLPLCPPPSRVPARATYLIAGGEDHKSGEADDGAERFAQASKPGSASWCPSSARRLHRWSGQVMTTLDHLRLYRPRPARRARLRGDRRFGPGHHARRPRRPAPPEPDRGRARAPGKASTIPRARAPRRSAPTSARTLRPSRVSPEYLLPSELESRSRRCSPARAASSSTA